jgi:hypothetical protein
VSDPSKVEPEQVRQAAFPDTVDDADPEDRSYPEPQEPALPGDDYMGAEAFGTTTNEELEGESLEQKLAREEPETASGRTPGQSDAETGTERGDPVDDGVPGRLVEPDEGAHSDVDAEEITSAPGGTPDLSPEEQAMHIERDASEA